MSECGSTRTCSSNGDGDGDYRFVAGTEVAIIEGFGKYRDGKKWKPRFIVLSKLSPAADCLQLQVYRDEKEKVRNGHTKASLSLQHFLAVESGFTLDKESHTLAIICQDLNVVLAFDNRERLIQWSVRIANNLGEAQQFLVQLASAPVKSKLNPGPVRLHVTDKRFCLTGGIPPKLLGAWEISQLRRYGLVDGRLVFEGGSRCGKGEGVHVLIPDPPQLIQIIDAFDASSKGHVSRGPSRRFGTVTDSPRKILGLANRLSEVRPLHDTSMSMPSASNSGPCASYNMNMTMSPTPRESRSAEELCAACVDTTAGPASSNMWNSSEHSSRCDLESCENLSVIGQCQQAGSGSGGSSNGAGRASSPVKQTISKPLPSAMERCLSCMSKLGQGAQLHDVLSPSWTMDLSTNTGCHNTSNGSANSDRLSISSHGSSGGGIPEYCYDTPRSVLMNEMRRSHHSTRSGTPPAAQQHSHQHAHGCCSSNSSVNSFRNCAHSSAQQQPHAHQQHQPRCDSPHRSQMLRNGAVTHAPGCQCHLDHALQRSGQGPIYYSIPEQPPCAENKTGINAHTLHHTPYDNYDFPKHSNGTTGHGGQRNCCVANGSSCSGASGDWIKNQPMDRSSIASSAHCSDHSSSDWYDTPKPHDSLPIYNNVPANRSCQCCQNSTPPPNNIQMQTQATVHHHQTQNHEPTPPPPHNPLENYDFPQACAVPVSDGKLIQSFQSQRSQNLPGRVNGEGKMPLVTSSLPPAKCAALNTQAIYAQVDKSKKTPRPIPQHSTCDNKKDTPAPIQAPAPVPTLVAAQAQLQPCPQPLYSNMAASPAELNQKPAPVPASTDASVNHVRESSTIVLSEVDTNHPHSNYVNLNFVDSLLLYENAKEIRESRSREAEVKVKADIVNVEPAELVKNMQITEQRQEVVKEVGKNGGEKQGTSGVAESKTAESSVAKFQEIKGLNSGEKTEKDVGEVILPLRRSSSVPCKGGHANRGSASSSDSGVSGDGGLYFDDSSPLNDFGNLCLHESLPRKCQRNSPGSTAGKNPSIASTPKPRNSDIVLYENTQAQACAADPVSLPVVSVKVGPVQETITHSQPDYQNVTANGEVRVPTSPKYETIQEVDPRMGRVATPSTASLNKSCESLGRRILKTPASSLVSDANSTSSGASDMSDYIESLSSCSRGSLDMGRSSSGHVHHLAANISGSPKKSTNMKPRSGKEYFKINRSMFAKQN